MADYAWYAIIMFSLAAYVVLDGYDLGVGILSLFDRDDRRRKDYGELIATAWDGNESWIILVGVSLWGGFPSAYATVLPGMYIPVIVMLFAIIARGAGIEFQSASPDYRPGWGKLFGLASLTVAICQGLIVGGVLSGVRSNDGVFAGKSWDWLTPYGVLCAIGAIAVYTLAGAAWLQDKTGGAAHDRAGRVGRPLIVATTISAVVLAFGLEVADPQHFRFDQPARAILFALAVVVAALAGASAWYGFGRRPDWRPFVSVLTAEAAGLVAVSIATLPIIVPPHLTVHSAASPHGSELFLLIGVGGCIPVVLVYNTYAWWVFRGKFTPSRVDPAVPSPAEFAIDRSTPSRPPDPDEATPPQRPTALDHLMLALRRTGLVVLAVFICFMCQDIFGAHGKWIDPLGVAIVSLVALAAWIWSDKKSARSDDFVLSYLTRETDPGGASTDD